MESRAILAVRTPPFSWDIRKARVCGEGVPRAYTARYLVFYGSFYLTTDSAACPGFYHLTMHRLNKAVSKCEVVCSTVGSVPLKRTTLEEAGESAVRYSAVRFIAKGSNEVSGLLCVAHILVLDSECNATPIFRFPQIFYRLSHRARLAAHP